MGSNSFCEHIIILKTEIWIANVDTIIERITVFSVCEIWESKKNKNIKWISIYGPS
jgi:hypothetical protein